MTDWTPEEDEAFNEVEKQSNLGKQILRDIEGQPYYFEKRPWVGLTDEEIDEIWVPHTIIQAPDRQRQAFARTIEAKLKEKNNA